jgi:hypothetical protein
VYGDALLASTAEIVRKSTRALEHVKLTQFARDGGGN